MFAALLIKQLKNHLDTEIAVAVGEELITGILESVNTDFLTLIEKTDAYERETRTRIIIISQLSYIQVAA